MDKKYRFEQFLFTDYQAIEAHLAHMASKGWLLEKIGRAFWVYRRSAPQKLTYTVTYFSEASEFNPRPTDNQQAFYEYCRAAGWEFVAGMAQMQIFVSSLPHPVPIETDEAIKLKTIHKAMKKNFLPSSALLILLSFLQLGMQWSRFRSDPIGYLSTGTNFCIVALWLVVPAYALYMLWDYWLWYRRSRRSVESGGTCASKNTRLGRMIGRIALFLACLLFVLFYLLLLQDPYWKAGLLGGIYVILAMAAAWAIHKLLKKMGAPRAVNLAASIAGAFVLSFGLLVGTIFFALNTSPSILSVRRQPADTYTTTSSSGHTVTWDVYHDPIPLTLEDLGLGDGYPHYTYELQSQGSPFLRKISASQDSFPDGQEVPSFRYEILIPKLPGLYTFCVSACLEEGNRSGREYMPVDESAWGAQEVYRLWSGGEPEDAYLVCWPDRILSIDIDGASLTPDQISAAAAILSSSRIL